MKYTNLKSTSISIEVKSNQDIIDNAPDNAWFIAYLYHRVVIGQIKDGKFVYYQDNKNDVTLNNIQKLRAFNKDAELFIWRTALAGYKARLKTDGEGEEKGVVDAWQVMFGTKAINLNDSYSILTEDRGTEIILPLCKVEINKSEINDEKGRLCIHTRSYIGTFEETLQATYEDVRFVEFVKYQEEYQ
jgi:CRISPR-associated protein (TIGR03984 family)